MATSSIMKQFVVKDYKAFEKLMQESTKLPNHITTQVDSSLDKGRKALKKFHCVEGPIITPANDEMESIP